MPRNDPDRAKERAYMTEYRVANREKVRAYGRKWYETKGRAVKARWRAENPESLALYERRCNLKTKYGLTPEDYDSLVAQQRGLCSICREKTKLVVDHDHETDEVRGLLCVNCNLMLGHARDSVPALSAAIEYLCSKTTKKEVVTK